MMIMSCPWGTGRLLTASRSRRFARFRSTAPPTARLATNATRVDRPGRGSVMTVMPSRRRRTPPSKTAARSERLRRRSGADVLPTLVATTLDHTAASARAHSGPESVLTSAPPIVRLIRAFHGKNLLRSEVGLRLRRPGRQCKGVAGVASHQDAKKSASPRKAFQQDHPHSVGDWLQIAKRKQPSDVALRDFGSPETPLIVSVLAMLKGSSGNPYIPATVSAGA